ncbi:MAG: FtsX-like permease family protein [Candidatus Bathyarchaeia archaeon]
MKQVLTASLVIILSLAVVGGGSAHASPVIKGRVVDESGLPLGTAKIMLWVERALVATSRTGPDGLFEIDAEPDRFYDVIAFADDPSTPGVDYLPARVQANASDGDGLVFVLEPAASIVLDGDIQFVESNQLPISVLYMVLDRVSGEILERNGFQLVFGYAQSSQGEFLGLKENHIVVPAGEPFKIGVNSSIIVGSDIATRYFEADEPELFSLAAGDRLDLDVRKYSIQVSLDLVESLIGVVEGKLGEMGSHGFYVVSERAMTAKSKKLFLEAKFLHEEERFIESFDACKMGYIGLAQTMARLTRMMSDASFSVYTIIVFLALSSTAIAFLLSNRDSTKILGGVFVYALSLLVLYNSYPGSVIIPTENFLRTSVLAMGLSITVAMVLPKFMKGRGRDGHVPVRNMVVPIFSLAKRSMRRRRLRFLLTLASIAVLVMSFVSLTSFSEGYGLIVSRVSGRTSNIEAVLLRSKGYEDIEPVFISQMDADSGWLERQPESLVVSPKAENFPSSWPIAMLNGTPVWGVLGIEPSLEASMTGIAHALMDGEFPSGDGVAISEALREEIGVEIGDTLWLSGTNVELVGVLDDGALSSLREIEGSYFLPGKLVNLSPEGEVPRYVVEPCEPSEIVVLHISRAVKILTVGISRVAIKVREGLDAKDFAERLALERDYWAWAASADGVYYARLGSYLEGKGLPLVVPWGIVVLNVVVTMLNSMYERRKEIHILSSVGLNPAQIAAIFVAEATIIGLTAGGLGYLAGLGFYKGLGFLRLALEVRQKVSAVWSIASIGIAMTAVLMGALSALKGSVVITPSLMRKWRIESEMRTPFEPFEIVIPVRLLPEDVDGFVEFVVRGLRRLEGNPVRTTSSIKVFGKTEEAERRVDFVYKTVGSVTSNFYTKNSLLIERPPDEEIIVRLRSYGERSWAYTTGSMVRMLAMRWSVS